MLVAMALRCLWKVKGYRLQTTDNTWSKGRMMQYHLLNSDNRSDDGYSSGHTNPDR
jgi:hypothetical protein